MNTDPAGQPQKTQMPDEAVPVPAMVCHYTACLQTWLHVTPGTSVHGNQAQLRLRLGRKALVAMIGCRKKSWSLHKIEIHHKEQTTTFTRGELDKALALLLGQEPMAPALQAPKANPQPRTDSTLRERRNTVIRT